MLKYQPGLTPLGALIVAEACLASIGSGRTADDLQVAGHQLAAHSELAEVADCLNSLAQLLRHAKDVPLREWQAAWGATLAAVRTAIEEREGVRRAA